MPNKYHAKKQYYKGMRFDSKKEFQRYLILEKMEKQRMIFNLEIHPQFPLIVNGKSKKYSKNEFRYNALSGRKP